MALTITQTEIDTWLNVVNVNVFINDQPPQLTYNPSAGGSAYAVQVGDEIKFTTIEGFEFGPDGVKTGAYEYDPTNPTSPSTGVFTISEDNLSATWIYPQAHYDVSNQTNFSIDTQEIVIEISGTNNIYKVDNNIVSQITNNRFVYSGADDSIFIDYGDFILALIELPTEIDPDLILPAENIELGDSGIPVEAERISTDKIVIDMGVISTPEDYGNFLDFENTVCQLHLPYSSTIVIEPEYIIGQDLTIEYTISAYTGKATINLSSTKVGKVFFTQESTLGINIPYSLVDDSSASTQNSSIAIGGDNRISKAYIEIIRNDSPLSNKFFTIPTTDEDLISNQSGYVEVDNVNLSFATIGNEKEDIISILNDGVIIND